VICNRSELVQLLVSEPLVIEANYVLIFGKGVFELLLNQIVARCLIADLDGSASELLFHLEY
jgi:hypothetical protein